MSKVNSPTRVTIDIARYARESIVLNFCQNRRVFLYYRGYNPKFSLRLVNNPFVDYPGANLVCTDYLWIIGDGSGLYINSSYDTQFDYPLIDKLRLLKASKCQK